MGRGGPATLGARGPGPLWLRAIAVVLDLVLGTWEPGRDTWGGVSALSPGQWLERSETQGWVGRRWSPWVAQSWLAAPGELVPWSRLCGRSEAGLLPVSVTGLPTEAASAARCLPLAFRLSVAARGQPFSARPF